MQHSPRRSARLNGGEATPITTVSQQPASNGAGTRTRVNITTASIPCPATTVSTTVAFQPRSTAVTAASSVPEVNHPLVLELMERIAALERELVKARSLESVSTANCAPIAVGPSAVGANSGASGRPPFWSGQPIPTSNGEALQNGVGSVPYNGDGASGAACTLPPSSSGPPLLTTSNYFLEPLCARQ
ncbi:agglutinin-like protein ARB_02240 [Drosophila sechellia]|uniref:agglutinin-like protein ARB_02240 n=1 Tax=Drosophila sechellia TaxID=7238 RepID=UPI0013DE2C0C|nr:agglutinin-like protein ARB_02240 [Drosophila sechellia]